MSRHKESPRRGASEGAVSQGRQGFGAPQWKSGTRGPPRDHGCQQGHHTEKVDPREESSSGRLSFLQAREAIVNGTVTAPWMTTVELTQTK